MMKLEYIPDAGTDYTQLVRLYDFGAAEVVQLCRVFGDLASGTSRSLELHNACFIDAMDDCRLTLMVNHWDQGLVKTDETATFQCALTLETWSNLNELTKPFTQPGEHGFQWLDAINIRLLLSQDGRW